MNFKLNQLELPLEYTDTDLHAAAAARLGCPVDVVKSVRPVRRSVDARPRRTAPVFIISAEVEVSPVSGWRPYKNHDTELLSPDVTNDQQEDLPRASTTHDTRPVVVGAGPAGLMAAFVLAKAGANPLLIDRGGPISERVGKVAAFWREGVLDLECNTLYGAGGAGLFSDGKLTARSKDRGRMQQFFSTLVECGAPDSILIDAEPHLGSDVLQGLVERLLEKIIRLGGEVRFHARCDAILRDTDGSFRGVQVNGQDIPAGACILATGHSSRDTYRALAQGKIALEAKPFAIGVRLELPQEAVDRAMYGRFAGHPTLGAASFKQTRREEGIARACYTFCTCPGGLVISCASEPGMLTTNGMSYSQRSSVVANSAFLVPVTPADFSSLSESGFEPLAGLAFQEEIEKRAFQAGGGDFQLPASPLDDFLAGRTPQALPDHPRSCLRANPADLGTILPTYVTETLRSAIPPMLKLMSGITHDRVLLYAAETRSSSPVRVVRTESGVSMNTPGLFPAGEGAGYAGGIVSSAIDGMKAAEAALGALK